MGYNNINKSFDLIIAKRDRARPTAALESNKAINNFVVLPPANKFTYMTSFYKDIMSKQNFKNCLIGVVSDYETLESKRKQQIQSFGFFEKI